MNIFPAIDIKDKKVVRLLKGDYGKITVYGDNPLETALSFKEHGAEYLHTVDLDGAKNGVSENSDIICELIASSGLKVQTGGGIRNEATVEKYMSAGVFRVILGTASVKDPAFLKEMVKEYGSKIAVGVDIDDGYVAINGWTEKSDLSCFEFCEELCKIGVSTIICTDISKDGAMAGTNRGLYRELSKRFPIDIIASGGVSDMEDVTALASEGIYGAIIGRALYNGAINLSEAIKAAKEADAK
ncbi:MAG: 1-(5-phosphoribosyl)-5-[(5-phosphoribosylamino)methylideneamino]imidazole-4-carboxamide isomerase [Clostridia bacterium]|nr:1-(5-phosphoribosyl)-5-[(5-phosphoribosylamino)methylideneamino]imidazole-4-carboxamide isomerase [Clostridia bacterium]